MRFIVRSLVASVLFSGILAFRCDAQSQAGDHGPPAFLTFPILTHVAEPGLDHGHFVSGGEAALPAPRARDQGAQAYSPAESSTQNLSSSSDLDVSANPASYEGETGAASFGSLLLGGSNHIYPGACSLGAASGSFGDCAPYAYVPSTGTSWTETALPRVWNGTTFGIGFDPAIDYDKNGTFYYSYGVAPLGGSYPNAIVVAKSTNGTGWTKLTPVTFNKRKYFDDKYYLAVDRSNSAYANRIYVSWDRNSGNNQILYLAYSANGGSTWSVPKKVNDGTSSFERVIGAYPAVNQATGVVYDSWHDYARNKIFVDKSTNGGDAWGVDETAAVTHAGFGKDIGCVGGRSQGPAHALKVGPSGTLYLVYADAVVNRGFDVLLVMKRPNTTTWTTPKTLNDDSAATDQFQPTLSVESNGAGGDKVTVTFYDRREDSNNCLADVYATQSTDSGGTWASNVLLTASQSNFNGNPNGPGDYSSSAPSGGSVWPFFADHRTSNPQSASGGAFETYTAQVQ